jgi:DNA polymerase I-like protein with 3'-5' exonuclease and polymerase domains
MKFIVYDLSGIEAALIALYSGDSRLFQIIASGESIHDHNAKILFELDCPVDQVKSLFPKERQCAKNLGFATFYGAGWRRLKTVFLTAGFDITDEDAKRKLRMLKQAYPNVFSFHKEITEIFESGEVMYNLLGRPLVVPDPADAYMKGFNTLIQSSASDLCIRACEKAVEQCRAEGLEAFPVLLIHDCVMMEAESRVAERVGEILKKAMTDFKCSVDEGEIKLQVEGGISDVWEK